MLGIRWSTLAAQHDGVAVANNAEVAEAADRTRPWTDLRPTGLLWLINRVVFHPRGYALAIHRDDDGTCTGWSLLGDGSEPWSMGEAPIDKRPSDYMTEDELLAATKALLS